MEIPDLFISSAFQDLHDPTLEELLGQVSHLSAQVYQLTQKLKNSERRRNRYRKERNRTQEREVKLDKEFTELLDDVTNHETEAAAANVSLDFLRNQVEKLQSRNTQLAQDNFRILRQQQQRNKLLKRELQRARNRATTWENRWNALKAQIPEHPERESRRLRGYAAELEVDDEAILM